MITNAQNFLPPKKVFTAKSNIGTARLGWLQYTLKKLFFKLHNYLGMTVSGLLIIIKIYLRDHSRKLSYRMP